MRLMRATQKVGQGRKWAVEGRATGGVGWKVWVGGRVGGGLGVGGGRVGRASVPRRG